MSSSEAAELLRAAGVTLTGDEVALLHERTEGWPVGLYLAALYLQEGGSIGAAAASFGGDDRLVSEYVESELLERISGSHRRFLTRSAALSSISAGLCEAVLGLSNAAATLAELAASNLLLVPLDRRNEWYRYHHLFGDMLTSQLERIEPGMTVAVRQRAATWCIDHGRPEEALEYSISAGDVATVVRLFRELWRPVWWQGRFGTLMRWLAWLDVHGDLEARSLVAAPAARIAMHEGHAGQTERWAGVMEAWMADQGSREADPLAYAESLLAEAYLCRHGVMQMRADADEAAAQLDDVHVIAPGVHTCQGVARVLLGDLDDGEARLTDAVELAIEYGALGPASTALCQHALVAMTRGEVEKADALTDRADAVLREVGLENALVAALLARKALRHGDLPTTRRHLTSAQRLLPLLTYVYPIPAVQSRLELARLFLGLGEPAGVRTMLQEISDIFALRPDLGTLVDEVNVFKATVDSRRRSSPAEAPSLTTAEMRLLPMLCTHLTYQEIADELTLSKHTIHAQARSMFRKLGASTRSEAVRRSRELTLLD